MEDSNRIIKLKELMAVTGSDNFLEHALALEYIKMGNDTEARLLFENLLHRDPSYVGSYYHLAKLLERANETELAKEVYLRGMDQAKAVSDQHSYNELMAAYEDLEY